MNDPCDEWAIKRKKHEHRVCIDCGSIRNNVRKDSKSQRCSKCRYNATKRRITMKCIICEAPFEVKQSEHARGIGKYCSRVCQLKRHSI
jgi:hypothetical protein